MSAAGFPRAPGMAAAVAVAALGLASAGGCDAFAYVLVKTVGPFVPEEEHQAEFDLTGKSVLVLVDVQNPTVSSEHPRVETLLAEGVLETLKAHQATGPLVPVRSVQAARRLEADFPRWSVVKVGKYFNVDMVLHVQVFEFRIKDNPGSNVLRGYAEAAVRIVSPETGEQVWPMLAEARLVTAEAMPEPDLQKAAQYEEDLARGLGEKIARHFCTYKPSELPLRPKVK